MCYNSQCFQSVPADGGQLQACLCLQMREIDKGKGSKRKGPRGDNEGDDVGDRIKFKKKY
jgi:hypothetical protein